MKRYAAASTATATAIAIALSMMVVSTGWAQSGGMGDMDMKNMDMTGMDKKKAPAKAAPVRFHKGVGTVTAVDSAKGKVTIAHGPIQTMKWPAMTMAFGVKDKALLDKLSTGKKVEFEFTQEGSVYTITSTK